MVKPITVCLLLQGLFLGVALAAVSDYFFEFPNEFFSSVVTFKPYTMEPPAPLEGPLAPNSILDRAELVLDGEFSGPESIAYRGNEVYAAVVGGFIIRYHEKNGTWEKVVQTGKPCAGAWEMKICGRPQGLRWDSTGKLIVADSTKGVLSVDVDKRIVESLLPRYSSIGDGYEFPLNFANDLDIGRDGMIYFSDVGQQTTSGCDYFADVIGNPTGRLIKLDPRTGQSEVLMKDLRFSNGVQLSTKQDFVTVAEYGMARVWKYYFSGAKKGQQEILVDNLPGLPDNIRSNGKGGFYIALVFPRDAEHDILRTLAPQWWLRQFIHTLQRFMVSFLQQLYSLFPNEIVGQWLLYAMHSGEVGAAPLLPRKAIIVEVDENGNILGSLQNRLSAITELSQFENRIGHEYSYFGSPSSSQFWRIKTEYIH